MPGHMRNAHRLGAAIVLLFVVTHLGAHLWGARGPEAHARALGLFQSVYRQPLVEPLLILAFLFQVSTGVRRVLLRWRETDKGLWGWAQIISGLFIGFFVLAHTSAALATRHFAHVETNFYWPAGSLTVTPIKYAFAPYYAFAIMAIFTHVAAAIHFAAPGRWRWSKPLLISIGLFITGAILLIYSGGLFPIELPEDHKAYFDSITSG
ncbi:MAG: hypothetical protein AAFR65_13745 [Pseudomonadota bacterium]